MSYQNAASNHKIATRAITYRGVSSSNTAEVMPLQSLIASAQQVMPTHSSNTLTLEMIQQMQQLIHSAFSALGLSG